MNLICPGCEASVSERLGTAGVCELWRCGGCGLVFANRERWRDPYADKDYYDPENQPAEAYPLRPTATDRDRIATVRRWKTAGRLLDFGGGVGRTALAAHQAGFSAMVLEDSHQAVAEGRKHHPEIDWIEARVLPPELAEDCLEVVTLFHVLEHLLEPAAILRAIHRALKPGGVLVVEVPNWGSHFRRLQGLRWLYVLDHHVNHFDARSLTALAVRCGFDIQGVEYRRTFAINETQRWKEPLKRLLCWLGWGDILRCTLVKPTR